MSETKRRPGRPRVANPRKQLPLIQVRASQAQRDFIQEAAFRKGIKERSRFVLEVALVAAAKILRRKAP